MYKLRSRKIFILLPDGVGLRNFAFTSFVEIGRKQGWEVVFWNHTPFDLAGLGFEEIRLQGKPKPLTDLLKRAKILAELNHFREKFQDPVYQEYKFPASGTGLKAIVKNLLVSFLTGYYRGEKGLKKLRNAMTSSERGSAFYKRCRKVLEQERPDLVFCTNQRPVNAIAPLTAARDLGIRTGSFIFSWDNLPKATLVVEPEFYFVWSDHMKKELLKYYPLISGGNIFVTGTPQFEPHFDEKLLISKQEFYSRHDLDADVSYLCYSGDDITTAPHDELYLKDVAEAVEALNSKGEKLGIIFRRCPVDFSDRYDEVLEKYKEVIIPIAPLWEKTSDSWNSVLPKKEDIDLQVNIIAHTFMVINIASSMVFDFVSFGKTCAYLNYNPEVEVLRKDTCSIYRYVHFRSMPSEKAVLWINGKQEIAKVIQEAVATGAPGAVEQAQQWFEIINQKPAQLASKRIWQELDKIT